MFIQTNKARKIFAITFALNLTFFIVVYSLFHNYKDEVSSTFYVFL